MGNGVATWPEYESLLNAELDNVNKQINDVEKVRDDAQANLDEHRNIMLTLRGDRVIGVLQFSESSLKRIQDINEIIESINEQEERIRDDELTLASFLENEQIIDVTLPSGNVLQGSYDFNKLYDAFVDLEASSGVRTVVNHETVKNQINGLWDTASNIDVENNRRIVERQNAVNLAPLEEIRNNLNSDDVSTQVNQLGNLAPDKLDNLPKPIAYDPGGAVSAQEKAVREFNPNVDVFQDSAFRPDRFQPSRTPAPSVAPTYDAGEMIVDGRPRPSAVPPSLTDTHPLTGATGKPSETGTDPQMDVFTALRDAGYSNEEAFAIAFPSEVVDGPGRPDLAETQAADRAEVENFLRTQFGGFEFFLNKHESDLQVGITADGMITGTNDPAAVTAKNVLDVIVEQGLTDPSRIEGALQNTEWWKTTDAQARVFDVAYANMNDLERLEYVEPTMDVIREELQFLGAEMSDADRQDLAAQLTRLGDQADTETVRDMIIQKLGSFDSGASSISDFAAARDEIEAMSRQYFVPIGTDAAGEYAQKIYLGDWSSEKMEQYFKEHALSKFPTLENAIKNGFTPQEYFAPYKYEIERMLGRPNIDLYDEFADVIEYFPDTGGDSARPMTMHEVRKYVRGLPEWQTSSTGTESAEALAFAIGKTFGEVA